MAGGSKKEQPSSRTVLINGVWPSEHPDQGELPKYKPNKIKTAKYTPLTFLPKNLFGQFRRIANFYFLIVAIIQLSIDSPVSPITSTLPLLFVVTVTMLKQGYEDYRRSKEDGKFNSAEANILNMDTGEVENRKSCDIRVGDIVRVGAEEEFPCDLLLLTSSDPGGKCEVTTANLDGETNLKTLYCLPETRNNQDLHKMRAVIECQTPHPNLYDYKGRLQLYEGNASPVKASLAIDNLLLKGARLQSTDYIFGCAIYTGMETKMALNLKFTNNKFSTVEKTMNYILLFFMLVLASEITICTIIRYTVYGEDFLDKHSYIPPSAYKNYTNEVTTLDVVQDAASFLVIFNYIIPISLYVTLEFQKFLGALFFRWDKDITHDETGESAKCNTSDLNEELGQVQYLFTDKTGTLTENEMYFRTCSVDGKRYRDSDGQLYLTDARQRISNSDDRLPLAVREFLETLALCHTIQLASKEVRRKRRSQKRKSVKARKAQTKELEEFEYMASSPDEKALVEACQSYNVIFVGQQEETLKLKIEKKSQEYERLHILEFDSDRKCMSVIVRRIEDNSIWVLTKGAESSVMDRCINGPLHQTTNQHIDEFAREGLRTLAVARRELSENEYDDLNNQLNEAKQVLDGRETAVRVVTDKIENRLTLQGATGVEDLLQENVADTLESLRIAGIKVWVLTGDKYETALNIAYTCKHFTRTNPEMMIMEIIGATNLQEAEAKLENCKKEKQRKASHMKLGLVVDGKSLTFIMSDVKLKDEFAMALGKECDAVVCCRMSPKQKQEIVKMVKDYPEKPICAAIGDGANDVSMIQEAHVGLGVMGKEGRQAVRCSDFAFAKFYFLKKALLVHGHWYYHRAATLVQYSFYKNVVYFIPQLLYSIFNAFSTQPVYDDMFMTLYNIVFTALPIVMFGLFEQNISKEDLMEDPKLYSNNSGNKIMAFPSFIKWTLSGLWASMAVYWGLYFTVYSYAADNIGSNTAGLPGGQTTDMFIFGTTLTTVYIWVVSIKLCLESRYFNIFFTSVTILSILAYYIFVLLFHGFIIDFMDNYDVFWSFYRMHESATIMLCSVLVGFVALLPDLVIMAWKEGTKKASVSEVLHQIRNSIEYDDVFDTSQRRNDKATRQDSSVGYIRTKHYNKSKGEDNPVFDNAEGVSDVFKMTKLPRSNGINGNVEKAI